MTVIGKPGAIAISIAGVTDQVEKIAVRLMMAERLTKRPATESLVEYALGKNGLSTPENIAKVKSFFPADKVWESGVATPERELAATTK